MGAISDLLKKGLAMIPKTQPAGGETPAPKPVETTVPGKAVTDNSGTLGKAATEVVKRKKATEDAAKASE